MKGIDIRSLRDQQAHRGGPAEAKAERAASPWDFMNRDISLGAAFGDGQKEGFYHELGILLGAGIDLKASLDLLLEQRGKKREADVIRFLKDTLVSGQTFAQALQGHGSFGPYEYHSVQIGEETGRLAEIMNDLADYYRRRLKQRRLLLGALTYPVMVTLTSMAVVFFMLQFVVPMFADIFRRSGNELPYVTRLIMQASSGVKHYALPFFLSFSGLAIFLYSQRRKTWYRRWNARLLLHVPIFGQLSHKLYLTRFCQAMSLLTAAKVPLIRALELCRQMVGFYPIEASLAQVQQQVMHGKALHLSLSEHAIYDSKLVALVKVGEEVNQLASFFDKVASQYQDEVEHRSAMLSSLLEPFIIIFLGILVGFILIAMYLPLFQVGNSFG